MLDDLFSGWGVRTLSAWHPAYNPYSYHRGSVWPVEQATFVVGFVRYGLHTHAERLSRAFFEAAALFDFYRLPELFSGHPRDEAHPFPAMYPQANSPQAWSASAVFCVIQSLLGLYPYAPLNLLLVDPHLPEWLPELTLRDLRVGQSRATIRFFRTEDGASDYRVLDVIGSLHIVRQPSPWSLTASFGERLRDPERPDNLWDPAPGSYAAHGRFDRHARSSSFEFWLARHKLGLAAAGLAAAAGIAAWTHYAHPTQLPSVAHRFGRQRKGRSRVKRRAANPYACSGARWCAPWYSQANAPPRTRP
jgi:hypothetical protein